MKFLSHLMKLLHLMTLPSQQFCLCGTLFNVHDTLMKHALRLALYTYSLIIHNSYNMLGHDYSIERVIN